MGMAVDNLSSIKSYQEQFDSGIKRKGLELQFRTYMGIKDLVKLAETSLQVQVQAAEQLVRNTGIPDYQKGSAADLRISNVRVPVVAVKDLLVVLRMLHVEVYRIISADSVVRLKTA